VIQKLPYNLPVPDLWGENTVGQRSTGTCFCRDDFQKGLFSFANTVREAWLH